MWRGVLIDRLQGEKGPLREGAGSCSAGPAKPKARGEYPAEGSDSSRAKSPLAGAKPGRWSWAPGSLIRVPRPATRRPVLFSAPRGLCASAHNPSGARSFPLARGPGSLPRWDPADGQGQPHPPPCPGPSLGPSPEPWHASAPGLEPAASVPNYLPREVTVRAQPGTVKGWMRPSPKPHS